MTAEEPDVLIRDALARSAAVRASVPGEAAWDSASGETR